MKKIALLGIALFLANVTFAQQPRTEFGLKGGVNLASLKTGERKSDARTGYHLGALAHIHFTPHFALQPELMYSAQGAEVSAGRTQKLQYINLPVLGQYMFGNGFRLQTGPQIGYLASSEIDDGHTEVDANNAYRKADFSWSFGAGYLTRSGLGVDARYNLGLNDISRNNSNTRNRVWQLGIFYQFRH